MVCGIYAIRNRLDGKFYVGQSVNVFSRWKDHRKLRGRDRRSHIYEAMNRHGVENFQFFILERCAPECLNSREAFWMQFLESRTLGYNIIPAGQTGRVMDTQARQAISQKLTGRKRPAETVEKVRQAMLGKRHTEETKRKLSDISKGRAVSPETRAKLSAIQKRAHAAKGHVVKDYV
jgi:group I intron endonuclease